MLKAKWVMVGLWLAYCTASLAAGATPADIVILTAAALPGALLISLIAHHRLCEAGIELWRWTRGGEPPAPASWQVASAALVMLVVMMFTVGDNGVVWATGLLGTALAAVILEERSADV